MLIIFFIAAVPKDSQRFQQRCGKPLSIFMPSHSVQSKAKPAAAWQLRYSFIFLIDEMQSRFFKMKHWACKAVAAAASSFIL
jgi:hypothetical protein